MKIDCPNCEFAKTIKPSQVKAFNDKYVLDGNVVCPKCEQVFSLGIPPQEVPQPTIKSPKANDAKPSANLKALKSTSLINRCSEIGSIIFIFVMVAGAINGAVLGLQSKDLGITLVAAAVGTVLAIIPAFMCSIAFKVFAQVLRLLVAIELNTRNEPPA